MQRSFAAVLGCVLVLLSTACVTNLGPKTVAPSRFDYNQAIANSRNEQLLLNLVRLRYRDTVQFLEVSSVLTQYSIDGSAGIYPLANLNGVGSTPYGAGVGMAYSERPTVTFTPLQGEDFARRLLAPVAPETLILLAQSGWSIERLALCCVEQINQVQNARAASGPTPDYVPRFDDFRRAARLLRELQMAGLIDLRVEVADNGEDQVTYLFVQSEPSGEWRAKVAEVRDLLGLPHDLDRFRLTPRLSGERDEISISARSVIGVLYFLSQAVEAPVLHQEQGKVTLTRDLAGGQFDWSEVTGSLLSVGSQENRPDDAFVRVKYRGHWFYIADNDLESKTTFNLLTLLFALQAAPSGAGSPLLTVSAGG